MWSSWAKYGIDISDMCMMVFQPVRRGTTLSVVDMMDFGYVALGMCV
jgi:hypothetical protein